MSEIENVYLADQSKFDVDREFWCSCCEMFCDVHIAGPDIVCDRCHFVIVTFMDREIVKVPDICGVSHAGGRNLEPIACGLPKGHEGEHSWATLPTFIDGMTKTEKAAQLLLRSFGEFSAIDGEWIDGLDKCLEADLSECKARTDIGY